MENKLLANTVIMDIDCYEETIIDQERYITLVDLIFNNTRLAFTQKNTLRIGEETAIIEYLKAIEPARYEAKVKELEEKNI